MDPFLYLNNDTISRCLLSSDYFDIKSFSQTCKEANNLVNSKFWMSRLINYVTDAEYNTDNITEFDNEENSYFIEVKNSNNKTTYLMEIKKNSNGETKCRLIPVNLNDNFNGFLEIKKKSHDTINRCLIEVMKNQEYDLIKLLIQKELIIITFNSLCSIMKIKELPIRSLLVLLRNLDLNSFQFDQFTMTGSHIRKFINFADSFSKRTPDDIEKIFLHVISRGISVGYHSLMFYFHLFTSDVKHKILQQLTDNNTKNITSMNPVTSIPFCSDFITKESDKNIREKICQIYYSSELRELVLSLSQKGDYDLITNYCQLSKKNKVEAIILNTLANPYYSIRVENNSNYLEAILKSHDFNDCGKDMFYSGRGNISVISSLVPILLNYIKITDDILNEIVASYSFSDRKQIFKQLLNHNTSKHLEERINFLSKNDI